jgi:2-polyprenyl-3-methyl-5-hydroxy-6-metoxy-1,4-benzoquinol methylase
MSLYKTIEHLPTPFNEELFTLLQKGIYDSDSNDAYINKAGDFACLDPLPQVDYVSYVPRVKALGLSQYKQTTSVIFRRFEKIQQWFSGTRSILEIGAGDGAFLRHVSGVFPSLHLAALEIDHNTHAARQSLTRPHEYSTFEEIRKAEKTFDLICLFHVLEHIADPREFLTNCLACLTPQGRIIIEVPSLDDPLLSLYDSTAYRKFYFQRQHPYIYSSRSLRRLLEEVNIHAEYMIPHQRYGLENHLTWLTKEKPGGNEQFRHLFSSVDADYMTALEKAGFTDAVIAIAKGAS